MVPSYVHVRLVKSTRAIESVPLLVLCTVCNLRGIYGTEEVLTFCDDISDDTDIYCLEILCH